MKSLAISYKIFLTIIKYVNCFSQHITSSASYLLQMDITSTALQCRNKHSVRQSVVGRDKRKPDWRCLLPQCLMFVLMEHNCDIDSVFPFLFINSFIVFSSLDRWGKKLTNLMLCCRNIPRNYLMFRTLMVHFQIWTLVRINSLVFCIPFFPLLSSGVLHFT